MTTRGSLIPGKLPHRVLQFFVDNPDERLTYGDACIKFGCKHNRMHFAIRQLTAMGLLTYKRVVVRELSLRPNDGEGRP